MADCELTVGAISVDDVSVDDVVLDICDVSIDLGVENTYVDDQINLMKLNLENVRQYILDELDRQTGILQQQYSEATLTNALSVIIDGVVAELNNSIAMTYSTKSAVASLENGVVDLRAEASTFTYVETADGKKAISGWKSVADSTAPSAFYVYADTFFVLGQNNGELMSIYPIQFIGEYVTAPLTTAYHENSVYKNSLDGHSYILHSGAWELWVEKAQNAQGQVKGICFLRSATTPATPSGGSYESPSATGWSDGIPAGTNPLYMTTRIFTSDGLSPQQSTWTTPQKTSALGQGTKVQFSIDGFMLWHDTPSSNDEYMRTGTSMDGGVTWTYAGAVKIKGEAGTNGTNGTNGARGAGWFNGTTTSSVWSDTEANALITNLGLTKVLMDKVTLSKTTDPKWSATKYWSGSAWIDAAMYVDGNLIVNGTIVADKISANQITSGKIPYQELVYHDMRTGGGKAFPSNGVWVSQMDQTFTIPSNFVTNSTANIRFMCLLTNNDTGSNRKIQLEVAITRVRSGTTFYVFPSYGSAPVVYDITIEDSSAGSKGMRNINIEELVHVQAGDTLTVSIRALAVSNYAYTACERIVAVCEAYNKTGS